MNETTEKNIENSIVAGAVAAIAAAIVTIVCSVFTLLRKNSVKARVISIAEKFS